MSLAEINWMGLWINDALSVIGRKELRYKRWKPLMDTYEDEDVGDPFELASNMVYVEARGDEKEGF